MKKLLKTITAIAASAVMLTSNAFAIGVNINGSSVSFDVEPIMVEDRVLVPMRAIFESLGAEVQWNEAAQSVTAQRGSDTITLTIGSPVMKVNGADVQLDSLPAVINDRTVVPVRAISEALGSAVSWNDAAQTVNITDNSGYVNPDAFNKYAPAWKEAYANILKSTDGNFELVYIDGDNIPELMISDSVGMVRSPLYIYTYANNTAVTVDWQSFMTQTRVGGTARYKERSGLLAISSSNMGNGEYCIFSLNNGVLSLEQKFESISKPGAIEYRWNGASISESTFENEWDNGVEAQYKKFDASSGRKINNNNIKAALGI